MPLKDLVQEGLLYRKRGMGTFVSKPKIEQALTKLSNVTNEMEQRGFVPVGRILHIKTVPATKQIAEKLRIQENEKVIELYRLRLADNNLMAIEVTFLPYK